MTIFDKMFTFNMRFGQEVLTRILSWKESSNLLLHNRNFGFHILCGHWENFEPSICFLGGDKIELRVKIQMESCHVFLMRN